MSEPFDTAAIDPNASAQELAHIAATHPEWGASLAWHPNVYPELLDWLAAYGDADAQQAVRARRAGLAAPTVTQQAPMAPVPAPARRARLGWIVGIAVLVVALVAGTALALGPLRPLLSGERQAAADRPPAAAAQPADFTVAAKPSFVDGTRVAWQLDLAQLQPTGEDPAFGDIVDYGSFWLISTSEFMGDLAHGGTASAVDASSGKLLWTLPDGGAERECAKQLVSGRLICRHDTDQKSRIESIDPATGTVTVEPDLGFEVGTVAAAGDSYLAVGPLEEGVGARLAKVKPGAGAVWKSKVHGWCSNTGYYGQTFASASVTDHYLAVDIDSCLAAILNPATGAVSEEFAASKLSALAGGLAVELPYCLVSGDASDSCGGTASHVVSQATLPDGSTVPVRTAPNSGYVWSGTDALTDPAPASWYFEGGDDCYLSQIVDVATGNALWSSSDGRRGTCPVQVGEGTNARAAFVILGDQSRTLAMLDPATGKLAWQRSLTPPLTIEGDLSYDAVMSPDSQTILVVDSSGLNAFSAVDGSLAWTGLKPNLAESSGWPWRVIPGPNGASLLRTERNQIARVVPAEAPTRVASMPAGIPDCPKGWTPLSWSSWDGGHTLVCRTSAKVGFYLEYVDGSQTYRTDAATASATGWLADIPGGPQLSISLRGALVQVSASGGAPVARYPSQVWDGADVTAFTQPPTGLPGCPSGSWPLSLSTWNGGWLLVCGTAADAPGSLIFNDGGRTITANSASYVNGAYCGQAAEAKLCAYRSPALVTETPPGGSVIQHSATQNWFAGVGGGGVGEGTGSYGVEAPDVNAADQLRYLDQILAKSKAARQTLSPSISDVRACKRVGAAITRIDAVTANREQLLAALDSAPVDALPEGPQLVADLQHVLALSRDTDKAYADWARAEKANGCSGGTSSPLWASAQAADKAVDGPKNAFVQYWNSQISGKYSVRTLANSDI